MIDDLTTVFHATYHSFPKSVYLFFYNCNFSCMGCIRNLTFWDTHLPAKVRERLPLNKRRLLLNELQSILLDVKEREVLNEVVLGGGEPTTDPKLTEILKILCEMGLKVSLLTNGYEIDNELIKKLLEVEHRVTVSIKAVTPEKHLYYTGREVDRVLINFKKMYEAGLNLSTETIYIPGLIEKEEVSKIARFISTVDPSIPLRIDAYIPVPTAPWRKPMRREIEESIFEARKYLKKVNTIHPGSKPKGKVICLWPRFNR